MVITEAHKAVLHGGIQATLGQIRTKYWILQGKSMVRSTVRSCVKCFKFKRATSTQLMGMLPKERITPCPPFLNTGIDYAGPFAIRVSKGRGTKSYKGYIALFICFSTKAIHLELVSDLTTTAFLAAFKRFAARRGTPINIYSDNGTNFVGARNQLNKELKRAIKQANTAAADEMANNGTNWNFIPPASPHFGGLWEAGVKSTKHHLKKIIGETMLTFEEFSTVLTQVEACLNSRPILPISNDLEEYETLTPGHFLIGRPLISHPESDVSDINTTQRWALVSKITQRFWKIWSMEYLTNLQQRPKWTATKTNYEAGQLVLIKDEQLPPTKWALGRITNTYPGPDGLTRVVSIKGPKNSEYKRPITKICLLPIEDNNTALTSSNTAQELSSKTELRRQQKRTTTNNHTLSVFTLVYAPLLILSTIIGICCSSETSYNITKFANEPGIYFEYIADLQFTNNNWNIIVFYNLTNYNAQLIAYRRCIDKLEHFCSRDPENVTSSSRRELCALIIPPFQQSLLEIEHKNELLNPQKAVFGRNKRGAINIIGNIASELFGVLDDRDAARYEQEIEKLKQDSDHLLALMKNQTSIIDITVNVFKKRQADIDEHWFVFKQQIEAALEDNDGNNRFLALSVHTLLMMTSFKEIQETLIEAVLDTHNQVTTTRLLTTQQLKAEVDLMARSIPTDIMLPTIDHTDDILALYQIMTTKTKLKSNYLIFEIKVPLVYKERYQMYKPIPLPTTGKPSMFVRPQVEYLVTDLHRQAYATMSAQEWQSCIKINDFNICKLVQAIKHNQDENLSCELQLMRQERVYDMCEIVERKTNNLSDTWVQLQDYRWLFSVQGERTFSIVCQQQPLSIKIANSGILSLGDGCSLKGLTITIPARKMFFHEVHLSLLPTFNISDEMRELLDQGHPYNLHELRRTQDLNNLQQAIRNEFKNEERSLSYHHIHHYTLTYSIVVVVLIIIIYCGIVRYRNNNRAVEINPLPEIA